jgi:hypothetical protein
MIYTLYPPIFIVPEESDFSDAWEQFCCKLENLKEKTDEIYRRGAPEQGIDLYYPSKHIAYQCKSVESGKSGDFPLSKTIASIRAAKEVQAEVGWEVYTICTNVDITGNTERKIKAELSDAILHPQSFWVRLCEKYPDEVQRNFKIVVDIPQKRLLGTINSSFDSSYSSELKEKLKEYSFDILLYSQTNDKVYKLRVSPISNFKIY